MGRNDFYDRDGGSNVRKNRYLVTDSWFADLSNGRGEQ